MAQQKGVVLLVALIMLVAMTLGGIALVRSVYTANIIAGNLAFQQSATNSADVGVQTAFAWLIANKATLGASNSGMGYTNVRGDKTTTWDSYWKTTLALASVTMVMDTAGNTVAYAIERLCTDAGCTGIAQPYYRITVRVSGPRDTVSYIQAIVVV